MSNDAPKGKLRSLKSLGQHFLVDKGIVRRIAGAAEVEAGDTVFEVGPGRGILTDALLERDANVIAVELDRGLHSQLTEKYADEPRLTLHHADALKFSLEQLPQPFKVVANLPYQVTTPMIFHLLNGGASDIVVMIQKEVALRILATTGDKTYGVLSLGVQSIANAKLCFSVPPGAFRPPPKVHSAVIRITPRKDPLMSPAMRERFMAVVRAALGTRRKTLKNALSALGLAGDTLLHGLDQAGIDPKLRGETLDMDAFIRLTESLYPDASD